MITNLIGIVETLQNQGSNIKEIHYILFDYKVYDEITSMA